MVNFIRIQLFLTCCAISVAWGQQAVPTNAPTSGIYGHGTQHSLAKFTGTNSIGDSAIVEAGGNLSTTDNVAAKAVSATINRAPGIATQSTNNTTKGSTDLDAAFSSGIRGVVGTTNSPAGIGVFGNGNASEGDPIGVLGTTSSTFRGIGVRGGSSATTGIGVGVLGETASPDGFAGAFNNTAASGYPIGAFGYVTSSDGGTGILGRAWSTTGYGIGVRGEAFTPDGVGGLFENTAGGNILIGVASGSNKFRVDGTGQVFADGGYQTGGADFAESIDVSGDRALYEPGDLLVIDPAGKRRLSQAHEAYSTLVAGIYSTKPGVLASMHHMDDPSFASEVPLAVMGIVPCKVTTEGGPINAGDLLVSSSAPGRAMKGVDRGRMLGAVVGKALEPLPAGSGVIQVLITLQ